MYLFEGSKNDDRYAYVLLSRAASRRHLTAVFLRLFFVWFGWCFFFILNIFLSVTSFT